MSSTISVNQQVVEMITSCLSLGVNRPLLGLKCEPVLPGLLYHWNIQGDSVQFSVEDAADPYSKQQNNKRILRGRQGKPKVGMVMRSVVSWSVLPVSRTASGWSAQFNSHQLRPAKQMELTLELWFQSTLGLKVDCFVKWCTWHVVVNQTKGLIFDAHLCPSLICDDYVFLSRSRSVRP